MNSTLQELFDYFTFANYGSDVSKEIDAEVFLSVLNIKGSCAYNRDLGTDAKRTEGRTLNPGQELKLRNQITEALQSYNLNVDDTTERRIAVPSDGINIIDTNKNNGELDIQFGFYKLRDLSFDKVQV